MAILVSQVGRLDLPSKSPMNKRVQQSVLDCVLRILAASCYAAGGTKKPVSVLLAKHGEGRRLRRAVADHGLPCGGSFGCAEV